MILNLLLSLALALVTTVQAHEDVFSIMIDPSGDAKTTGRTIDDSFERGLTLQCAQKLKEVLERHNNVRVILTRFAGETVEPLQNAHFANRLDVDLFVSLNFYTETAAKPTIYLYTFSYGNEPYTVPSDALFYNYDSAHWPYAQTTKTWAACIQQELQESRYHKLFDCKGVYKLPFKPLIGIKAPALGIEIGLKNSKDWHNCVDALVSSLEALIISARI